MRPKHSSAVVAISLFIATVATLSSTIAFSTPSHLAPYCHGTREKRPSRSRLAHSTTTNEDEEEDAASTPVDQSKEILRLRGKKVYGSKEELLNRPFVREERRPTNSNSAFSASPITLTIKSSSSEPIPEKSATKPVEEVNFATLRFNAKLNDLSKNADATTAPRVESLLLDALTKYEAHVNATQSSPGIDVHKDLVVPNTVSFTNAITAWARCSRKDSPYRASALLDRMHSLYKLGWKHVKPNKFSYNSVINAWARSKERGSAKKAERLLFEMYEFWEREGREEECKPDARSFNSVINAVARSREKHCADRAKFLLDEMGRLYNEGDTELLPHAVSFGAIINAYANSMEEGASDKAAQLLMHMESLHQLGFEEAKPTSFVYNACMNAFAKDPVIMGTENDAAKKAEQLLVSMEKRYEMEGDGRIKPDIISFSTVINAYANSATAESGINADAILRRMISRYLLGDNKCKPNAVAFTATIKAHSAAINATRTDSNSEDSKQLIETSAKRCEDLLQQLCLLHRSHGNDQSLKPTSVTFDLVLCALAQAEDLDAVERVKRLRGEESNSHAVERVKKLRDEVSSKSSSKR